MAEARLLIDTSNPEQVSDYVMKQANGVKGLSEMGIPGLPKQYIQPVSERSGSIVINERSTIPIIDLSRPMSELEGSIWAASESFGFFQVVNHGVPLEALDKVKEATYRFFGLPAEEKKKYLKENSPSNHVRLTTSFIPEAENALEWKDYLSLFFVSEQEALSLWPPTCRDQLLDYMKRCEALIEPLVAVLMKGLGIELINKEMGTILTGTKRINLNYYPKCPDPELTVGVGRHSDVSTFTILLQDGVGGLYVRSPKDEGVPESWIHVPPAEGALVINIGDALQIMSNGKYKSVEHRVVANGTDNRISVPLFVNPKPSDVIGPMDEVLKSGEKPKYRRVVYSDYVLHFYRKAHRGKDTLEYAKL